MNKCRTIETANQVEYEGFVNACLNDGYILSSSSCGMHGSEREGFGELWFAVLSLPPADKEECKLDVKVCSDCNEGMKQINKMYRKNYWKMIFNLHNTFGSKWIAIKSLWIMKKWDR